MSGVVTRCTNSTVTEAWATVLGAPARVSQHESGALVHMAQKKLPPLEPVPAVVLAQVGDHPAPPFWREQFGWDNGRYLARAGHRYLSVHFLKRAEKYDTKGRLLQLRRTDLTKSRDAPGVGALAKACTGSKKGDRKVAFCSSGART